MLKDIRIVLNSSLTSFSVPLGLYTVLLAIQISSYFSIYFILKNISISNSLVQMQQSFGHIIWAILALVVFFYAYCIFMLLFTRTSLEHGYARTASLRMRICDHLRHLPLSFFRKNNTSVLSGVLLRNMADAETFFGLYIYELVACVFSPLIIGIAMLFMDVRMALAMFGTVLVALPFAFFAARTSQKQSKEYSAAVAELDTALLEYFNGIAELKGAHRTGTAFRPYVNGNERFLRIALAIEAKSGVLIQVFIAFMDMVFIAALVSGSIFLSQQSLELGVFIFFLIMAYRFVEPLQNLGVFWTVFKLVLVSLRRISSIFEVSPLPIQKNTTSSPANNITFSKVHFSYGEKQTLSDISFSIPEGTVTALVGQSGGGKTTICNLLLRFWDVNAGEISIGGINIKNYSPEDLYAKFSAVFQDVYLFNDTVMNNIRFAKPHASDEEVFTAAQKAHCHDFVISLEHGYDTMVGERGSRLSGGEKQRIAIARAILKDAPIVILDEATASIDPENELLIQQGLTELLQGKTLLVIAHKLTTIQQADQILVLKDGMIQEKGEHLELLEKNGIYTNLWKNQEKLKSWTL